MSRDEKLLTLIRKAETNGFELRDFFQSNIAPEWPGSEKAITMLSTEGRLAALIFSHDFAKAFWKRGAKMQFVVPGSSYSRLNAKGQVVTINRKAFTRRTIKPDVWQYHLRQMITSDDPIAYLDRFLPAEAESAAQNRIAVENAELPAC
jgi:hypothetical protein